MNGEDVEGAKRSVNFIMDEVAESMEVEELTTLYAAYVMPNILEHKELMPDADHEAFEKEVREDIIKLAEAMKEGRI